VLLYLLFFKTHPKPKLTAELIFSFHEAQHYYIRNPKSSAYLPYGNANIVNYLDSQKN